MAMWGLFGHTWVVVVEGEGKGGFVCLLFSPVWALETVNTPLR